MVDVEPRGDGEEVSRLVSRGENVVGVVLSASRIQEKASAVRIVRNKKLIRRDYLTNRMVADTRLAFMT